MFQEQSRGRSVKQTFADQRDFSRSDFFADSGPIVTRSTTGRATDNQQQQDEKRTEGSQNARHHYVGVPGLLASLLPLVMHIQYHFLNLIAKYLSFYPCYYYKFNSNFTFLYCVCIFFSYIYLFLLYIHIHIPYLIIIRNKRV